MPRTKRDRPVLERQYVTPEDIMAIIPVERTRAYEIMHEAGGVHIGRRLYLSADNWRKWFARASAGNFAPQVEASMLDAPPPSAATEELEIHEPVQAPVEVARRWPREPKPKGRELARAQPRGARGTMSKFNAIPPELAKYVERSRRPSRPPPKREPEAKQAREVKPRQRKRRAPQSPPAPRTTTEEERLTALHAELRAMLKE